MFVSVSICTRNRAGFLDQTLASMHKLRIPPQTDWELIIVNNNSTDTTDKVISKHDAYLPIRRIFGQHQGKSFALNCSVRTAKGDYIIWTDDDVIVDMDWIACCVEAFKQWQKILKFGLMHS